MSAWQLWFLATSLAVLALFLALFAFALACGRLVSRHLHSRERDRLVRERLKAISQRAYRRINSSPLLRAS